MKPKIFATWRSAYDYFKKNGTGVVMEDIEECEFCGKFSMSKADHGEGGIVGSMIDDEGEIICDRACLACVNG